ncbi:major facilitator superfamily domain-containing protein [Dioszegia hungarica]|uniref:Major facilitator superfamily domain-containing protein n=1 Tax=Dioszegia hungarica TaxID=4972 RepID=A0AA38LT77_9TREE|nr:major facilitator superfamily domain-containing protein [Dioszegia hungarica]KAI9636612.1 major facilitator superfamily domain-containing protein [Dioszegia hungarica]
MSTATKPEQHMVEARHDSADPSVHSDPFKSTRQPVVDAEALGVNEKAVLRKTDLHLLPWLSFLYLLSFLDRTNIGNANLFGLSADLGLNPTQYSACLAVFFAMYVTFEVPSNMVMKAWRPSMWIPVMMLAWGIVMTLMGIVRNYEGLLVARIFLGVTEAGLFPGVSFFLTQWYRRYEINFRIALFFSAATIAGAFGGLLARLINLMDGVAGLQGWRWIFILEGIITVLAAIASFWILYDYPDTAKFLTPVEKQYMSDRLALDRDGCSHEFKYKFAKHALLDWKIWVFCIMYQGSLMPVYCFSLFSPTLVGNMGYTAANAQLLSTPPYVAAAICTIFAGWLSDKLRIRGPLVMGFAVLGAVGFIMLLASDIVGVQYTGLFLAAMGVYPLIPLIVSWSANNMGGSLKKGVGTAMVISMGNAGGIISSFLYPSTDRPRFIKGHAVCLAYCAMTFILAGIMTLYLARQNTIKDRVLAEHGTEFTAEEKVDREDDGENVPWFKYTV